MYTIYMVQFWNAARNYRWSIMQHFANETNKNLNIYHGFVVLRHAERETLYMELAYNLKACLMKE